MMPGGWGRMHKGVKRWWAGASSNHPLGRNRMLALYIVSSWKCSSYVREKSHASCTTRNAVHALKCCSYSDIAVKIHNLCVILCSITSIYGKIRGKISYLPIFFIPSILQWYHLTCLTLLFSTTSHEYLWIVIICDQFWHIFCPGMEKKKLSEANLNNCYYWWFVCVVSGRHLALNEKLFGKERV